jgi:hypothetical protein
MPNTVQDRLAELAAWFTLNSAPRTTPLGGGVLFGPWAVIVPCNLAEPPQPAFNSEALPLFVPASQDYAFDRLCYLLFRTGDRTLPRAAVVLLIDPAEPPQAAGVARRFSRVGPYNRSASCVQCGHSRRLNNPKLRHEFRCRDAIARPASTAADRVLIYGATRHSGGIVRVISRACPLRIK